MPTAVVYKITNKQTGFVYVGRTMHAKTRLSSHKSQLNHKRHGNALLQADWDRQCADDFEFVILEELGAAPLADLIRAEQQHIDANKAAGKSYNGDEPASQGGRSQIDCGITPAQVIAARGRRTQQEVAELLGVSLRQVRNYEKGVTGMRPIHFQALDAQPKETT